MKASELLKAGFKKVKITDIHSDSSLFHTYKSQIVGRDIFVSSLTDYKDGFSRASRIVMSKPFIFIQKDGTKHLVYTPSIKGFKYAEIYKD